MKYVIKKTSSFKTSIKKIKDQAILKEIENVIDKLANDEKLDNKYNDHKLKGEYKGYRECHIKPDLLLVYKKQKEILILTCVDIGSHSELF
uniref:Addiction module toxin RelE n=1 Tax=uncultured Helicobacter sp. TaxID=175537 RepID=A0A650EKY7_9HELI|nr:hypothetical protein Helico5904_1020 [uncultured Helicobacter sp.]